MAQTPEKHPLKVWMLKATPHQQQRLADAACNGSRAYLYQIANDHVNPSSATAGAIERATEELHYETDGDLPIVWRVDLNKTCGQCEFAKRCMEERSVKAGLTD